MTTFHGTFGLSLLAFGLTVAASSSQAETPRQEATPTPFAIGRLTVGTKIDALPDWAVRDSCYKHVEEHRCGFFDAEGLFYGVNYGVVETVSLRADWYSGPNLPLGLKRDATPDQNLAAVSAALGITFTKNQNLWVSEPLGAAPDGRFRIMFRSPKPSWFELEIADDQSLLLPPPVAPLKPGGQ